MADIENEKEFRQYMENSGLQPNSISNYISWLTFLSKNGFDINSNLPDNIFVLTKLKETEVKRKEYKRAEDYKNFEAVLNKYREFVKSNKEPPKEAKIARITWNTNKWVKPSGPLGKSSNESYEKENGFGHEEWLFDGDKTINGMKYGFLEPINKFSTKYEGHVFDISLYSIDGRSKKTYWITTLKDVEVIKPEESKKVLEHYKEKGWYDEMKSDLNSLNINPTKLDKWLEEDSSLLFNIKFPATQIHDIGEPIPMAESDIPKISRYILMGILNSTQQKYKDILKQGFSFESGSEGIDSLASKSNRRTEQREIEFPLKHNEIQRKFLKFLQKNYGNTIKCECKAYGASRIDITQKTDTGYIFYEIKTYNNIKTSLRESIGQLFEYCFYPKVQEAEKIVLVSDIAPSDEVIIYIKHIKKYIKIPFSYIQFDTESEEVKLEI
jgi:hypothetical protein